MDFDDELNAEYGLDQLSVTPILHDRTALLRAVDLVEEHGLGAPFQANLQAEDYDNVGKVVLRTYWRNVERAARILLMEEPTGPLH